MDEKKINPYDFKEEETRLNVLEHEIKQAESSLEGDFAEFAAGRIDERLEELFFEDKTAFISQILKLQNEFLKDLRAKHEEASRLRGDIDQKKALGSIKEAADAFDAKNLGVDSEQLLDFFENDLPPRQRAEFENLAPAQFFDALFKRYQEGASRAVKPESKNEALPARLNSSSAAVDANGGDEILTQRF